MEIMGERYKHIVNDCMEFARQFLDLPPQIELLFEECPSEMFPLATNSSETDGKTIYFNKPWFMQRIDEHRDDLEFFIFHELRHCHQIFSVQKMKQGMSTQDRKNVIHRWEQDFAGYVRNEDDETEQSNLIQEVEIDANAYGVVLTNLWHINDDMELHFSVPEYAMEIAFERSKQYYKSEQKVVSYIQKYLAEKQPSAPYHPQKYERNKPCPCGSGLKWKKCTCKVYH